MKHTTTPNVMVSDESLLNNKKLIAYYNYEFHEGTGFEDDDPDLYTLSSDEVDDYLKWARGNSDTTPNVKGSYVEPEGFEGTKGKWIREYQQYEDGSHECLADENGDWIADFGHEGTLEANSNSMLCKEAKEMAKALQALIKGMNQFHGMMPVALREERENAKQVLKNAGLSPDKIKKS